ncbi:MAG: tRNA (N6-isopentenyl adenosine(37)-C2)-methylthiotransferase MiaB [Clostridia bacterium]|nr:tRNA (N6-isopentenyl adenosine(37)-C2)-methylthiotransferase MiaB [Clostridia bacterium]
MRGKYFINTYGCQMNVHESEKLAGILREHGYTEANTLEECDIVVFNTCCVRETAEYRVLGNLGIVKKLKESKPDLKVAVCGCMAQKPGAEQALKKRCPFINIIFGTHNLHKFGDYLDLLDSKKYIGEVWDSEGEVVENVPVYRTSGVNAWVNIMYGCNNFCSYCIVPYVRGRERSRNESVILDDVKRLIGEGYKEITLLGQNVNSYGNDLADKEVNFANLLDKIANLDGKFKVRFMTSHPKDLSEDVVKVISSSEKLADYIHLPIQAGSDRILALMNRRYTKKDYLNKIDMIRKYIPGVGLSSDIMVGFPTETEEDFLETVDVVKRVGYNNLFTFIYSRRSGTPADKMEQVDIKIKKDRISRLIDLQFEIGNEEATKCVGKTYEVLCDEWKNGKAKGKSSCEKAISFASADDIVGKFVPVKITATKNNQLKGELVK